MDIEDKIYWLYQIRMELVELQGDAKEIGDIESYDDYGDMIEAIEETVEDLHRLEDLLT